MSKESLIQELIKAKCYCRIRVGMKSDIYREGFNDGIEKAIAILQIQHETEQGKRGQFVCPQCCKTGLMRQEADACDACLQRREIRVVASDYDMMFNLLEPYLDKLIYADNRANGEAFWHCSRYEILAACKDICEQIDASRKPVTGDRCKHGVWAADRCEDCVNAAVELLASLPKPERPVECADTFEAWYAEHGWPADDLAKSRKRAMKKAWNARAETMRESVEAPDYIKILEDSCWDLRCVDDCEDDYHWKVVGHWMAKPCERVIGYGTTAIAAIKDAMQPRDYDGNLLNEIEDGAPK